MTAAQLDAAIADSITEIASYQRRGWFAPRVLIDHHEQLCIAWLNLQELEHQGAAA